MSLSGIFYTNVGKHWRLQGEWSATQSISGNYSTVTLKMYWMGLDSYGTTYTSVTKDGSSTINGTTDTFTASAKLSGSEKKLIQTHVVTVPHNSDGTKSFSMSGYFDIELELSDVQYNRVNISSGTVTLNKIPRASTMTTSRDFTAGGDRTISISRASTSFRHEVEIYVARADGVYDWIKKVDFTTSQTSLSTAFTTAQKEEIFQHLAGRSSADVKMLLQTYSGSTLIGENTYYGTVTAPSATITNTSFDHYVYVDQLIEIGLTRYDSEFTHTIDITLGTFKKTITDVGWYVEWTPDATEQQSLYAQMPNVTRMDGTIQVTTYYGSQKVRSTTSALLQFHVRNSNPTFTADPSYKDVNSLTKTITGNDQYIIQNHSSVQVEIPVTAKATGVNGASIVSYVASMNGVSVEQPYSDTATITFTLGSTTASENSTLIIKAVDSRGNFTEVSKTVLIVPYTPPSVTAKSTRLNNFEKQTTLEVNGAISLISVNNVMKNALTNASGATAPIQYRYKENVEGAVFGAWVNFTHTVTSNLFDTTDVVIELDNTKSYTFEYRATDKLTTTTVTTVIGKGIPIFAIDEGRSSVGIGMFPTLNDKFQIAGTQEINVPSSNFGGLTIINKTANFDSVLALNTIGGEWTIRNDDSAGNLLDYRWNNVSMASLSTDGTLKSNFYETTLGGSVRIRSFDGVADFYFNYDESGLPRLRLGGTGTGAGSGFKIEGQGDKLLFLVDNDGQIKQGAWISPSLLNSWSNYGGAFNTVAYRKNAHGTISLKGLFKGGSVTSQTSIFQLPDGYRPQNTTILCGKMHLGADNHGTWRCNVETNGLVQFVHNESDTGTGWCSFDGMEFPLFT